MSCDKSFGSLAVGTGQALELGRRGDADVLMVHAPEKEIAFVKEGYGRERRSFMFNDFILIGPPADPAKIQSMRFATEALKKIAQAQATFISRGDGSGTHSKEQELWRRTGIQPAGQWHLEAGTGMSGTLRLANEKRGYTLSDRATFLAWQDKLDLKILVQGNPFLRNVYSVIVVSPAKHPDVNDKLATQFEQYLFSKTARRIIDSFGKQKFGQALFHTIAPVNPPVKKAAKSGG